jgi:hypothetical protein
MTTCKMSQSRCPAARSTPGSQTLLPTTLCCLAPCVCAAVIVVNILPPDTPSFKEVCYKYGGRLRHVLSSPNLVSIPGNSRAVSPEKPRQPVVASRSSSLFSCFSRAVVLDADGPPPQPEGKGIARRSQSFQLNPSTSVVGGSERSMRGGVVRDPSLRGCRRATTVEVRAGPAVCTPRLPVLCAPMAAEHVWMAGTPQPCPSLLALTLRASQ